MSNTFDSHKIKVEFVNALVSVDYGPMRECEPKETTYKVFPSTLQASCPTPCKILAGKIKDNQERASLGAAGGKQPSGLNPPGPNLHHHHGRNK